jgi:hypothetical protein
MQASVLRNILTVPTMIAVAVAVLLLSAGNATQASFGTPEFTPVFDQRNCNPLPLGFVDPTLAGTGVNCVQTKTASTATDIGTVFTVPAGHHNFSAGLFVATTKATIKNDADIVDGTKVGGLRSTTTLGLTNNVCGAAGSLFPEFVFFEGEADHTNTVAVQAEGTADRFSTLAIDTPSDGLPGIANANSPAVTGYPTFLNTFFNSAQPKARYVGLTQVPAGGDWQILQVIVFDPATLRAAFNTAGDRTHPFARMTPALGTVFVTLLNDPTATTPSISSISDFCSPLATVAGFKGVATTPAAAGNSFAGVITQSIRDNDSDGFDDGFDTCPFIANTEDMFGPSFDDGPDNDNYDSACDPTPGANTNSSDHDGDGFANAQDNCPNNPGGTPANSETLAGNPYTTAAADGGPGGDGMGDDCEGADSTANGGFFQVHFVDSNCNGADADDDGWCDGTVGETGNYEGTNAQRVSAASNSPAPNNATTDHDGDGVATGTEVIIGTDPKAKCSKISGHDAWPPDFDMNRVINTTDVFQVLPPVLGSSVGGASFTVRADLSPNGVINTTDVFQVLPPVLGSSCTV